ncbi:N(5)-(carboxyethyl)ornithine synthase [Glutamicibacter sp. MNS18]|uniref:N(5)-(carboxyethyl)ornithine synthase n=1 Tax=Glutamicibacter sp. MNS18 TaxID=2989817 RepID=UPI002235D451|nr:N(5)-(carboxyethyl)ornithine synthase [Glutamicibacter sp. MNS18]MCW4465001.1 N(5)-(carboxyethyl)ornithine synthase [Glutamicibacter sp. MNS18]
MVVSSPLTLGVIATSQKKNERRLPIHPEHLERIDERFRSRIIIESGYGESCGLDDDQLAPYVGAIASRDEIMEAADIILLPKPQAADLQQMREGQVLWGWPHCVQDATITQLAIDKKLTLIAFEAMNHWGSDGSFGLHVFHKNNELAGYASVIHALQLHGSTGDYGKRLSAVVIGFGATARGAVTALHGHGIHEVKVLTNRSVAAVASPIHSVQMVQFEHEGGPHLSEVITDAGRLPLAPFLAESDIVVNCTLQDPNDPLMYLRTGELAAFTPGSIIVDVSCDEGMGFEWAVPTTFDEPMFTVGPNINYYAVDHSPSYLWNSASWEISEALLPFLDVVLDGPEAWKSNTTINRAIEIHEGVVRNPAILQFQQRAQRYPHPALG